MADFEIFVFILGDSPASDNMFPVVAPASMSVGIWRESVYAKKQNSLKGYDAASLILWKLKQAIPLANVDQEVIWPLGHDFSGIAEKMLPANDLLDYFLVPPPRKSLHVIAVLPSYQTSLPVAPANLSNNRKRIRVPTPRTSGDALPAQKRRRLDLLEGSQTIYKLESDPERQDKTPLLPTGSNFDHLIHTPNIVAADKTSYIAELDKSPEYQLMLLRPRRWGKSTFLQMLANYYDMGKADQFDNTFGQLYIGKNPTPDRSSLLVLLFDFSRITTFQSPDQTRKELDFMMLHVLHEFLETNKQFLGNAIPESLPDDGADALDVVLTLVKKQNRKLFVGVDEYDAPANACLFSPNIEYYHDIAALFKGRFFAIIKESMGFATQKYWLTGVLPAFRDGISPLHGTQDISISPQYNNACGLTEDEVKTIAMAYLASTHSEHKLARELSVMKERFNGYKFCPSGGDVNISTLYNPQQIFTHLRAVSQMAGPVRPDQEVNATHSGSVLNAIRGDGDLNVHDLLPLLSGRLRAVIMTEFGAGEVRHIGQSAGITWTLLYYFGVITHGQGNDELRIPNVTMRHLVCNTPFSRVSKKADLAFTKKMTTSCASFIGGNSQSFVELLEEFFRNRPVRSVFELNEATLQSVIEICWFEENRCLPELRLVVDPAKAYGEGRFGFVDLFITSSPESHASSVALIELKQVTLHGLCRARAADPNVRPSYEAMESLRMALKEEHEDELLQRSFYYWDMRVNRWQKSSILNLKERATQQVNNYLRFAKNGAVKELHGGIHDDRIICEEGEDRLVAHVVIGIGGTRVLTWEVGREQTEYSFRKALN